MVQLRLLVVQAHLATLDKAMLDKAGAHIEDVAAADDDVGVLTGFE